MKRTILTILALLFAVPAWATIAFDAATEGTGTTTFTWQHIPAGTPGGVFVFCIGNTDTTDIFSGAKYGASAMTQINNATDAAGEPGFTEGYFLGASIPTGEQTVECTVSSGTTAKWGVAITVTAGADTEAAGIGSCTVSGDTADPSCTVTGISGASYGAAGLFSGGDTGTWVTAGAGETERHENDFGSTTTSSESSTTEQATGDQVLNFTANNQDVAMVGIAIQEAGGATRNRAVVID